MLDGTPTGTSRFVYSSGTDAGKPSGALCHAPAGVALPARVARRQTAAAVRAAVAGADVVTYDIGGNDLLGAVEADLVLPGTGECFAATWPQPPPITPSCLLAHTTLKCK